jgi:DNA-cytosine methyltransferase
MNHGSLFSGIGGFDLASQWMGWNNVFHCEIEEFPRKILEYYWPQAKSYEDIKQTDFSIWRGKIDILSGGFPCQPYSTAGKRQGKNDSRHLWPEMYRAIQEIRPRWVVGENVRGIVSWNEGLVFDEVCAELENEGYEVIPFVLPAAGINAPHKRERVFFIARKTLEDSDKCRQLFRELVQEGTSIWEQRNISTGSSNGVYISEGSSTNSNLNEYRREEYRSLSEEERVQGEYRQNNSSSREFSGANQHPYDEQGTTTHPNSTGDRNTLRTNEHREKNDQGWQGQSQFEHRENGEYGNASNTSSIGRRGRDFGQEADKEQERQMGEGIGQHGNRVRSETSGRSTDVTNTDSGRLEGAITQGWDSLDVEWEGYIRRTTNPQYTFSELHRYANTGWEAFPTQSPICGRNDGISSRLDDITFPKWRKESIKGYGNAIVPQLVLRIFKAIEDFDNIFKPNS